MDHLGAHRGSPGLLARCRATPEGQRSRAFERLEFLGDAVLQAAVSTEPVAVKRKTGVEGPLRGEASAKRWFGGREKGVCFLKGISSAGTSQRAFSGGVFLWQSKMFWVSIRKHSVGSAHVRDGHGE